MQATHKMEFENITSTQALWDTVGNHMAELE